MTIRFQATKEILKIVDSKNEIAINKINHGITQTVDSQSTAIKR